MISLLALGVLVVAVLVACLSPRLGLHIFGTLTITYFGYGAWISAMHGQITNTIAIACYGAVFAWIAFDFARTPCKGRTS